MRRIWFAWGPVLAWVTACMQVMPNGGNGCHEDMPEDGYKVGGKSIGCGNPPERLAVGQVNTCDDRTNQCIGHSDWLGYSAILDTNGYWIRLINPTVLGGVNETQGDTAKFDSILVTVYLADQVPGLVESPLGQLKMPKTGALLIENQWVCDRLNIPDRVCSEQKVEGVELVLAPVGFTTDHFDGSKIQYRDLIHGLAFDVKRRKLVSLYADNKNLDLFRTMDENFGKITGSFSSQDNEKSSQGADWFVYVAGDSVASRMCDSHGMIRFNRVPMGRLEMRGVRVDGKAIEGWFPVYTVAEVLSGSSQSSGHEFTAGTFVNKIYLSQRQLMLLRSMRCSN